MTRTACLCIVILACIYSLATGWELHGYSAFTVPVLMWSDKQIFTQSQVSDTVTSADVEFALTSLLHRNTNKGSKIASSFNEDVAAPELVILFVEPELRTDQVPYIASAYASTPGGSFSHLKSAIETSKSSLVMPYATVSEVTLLDETLLDLIDATSGKVFMSSVAGSKLFSRLRQLDNVKTIELGSLISTLESDNVFTNGMTDLVIVSFDTTSSAFSQHDAVIGDVMERISAKGNYAAVYAGNMPAASKLIWSFNEHNKAEFARSVELFMADDDNTTNGSNTTNQTTHHHKRINYFPGPFIEVLLVVAILLTMLFTGACAIFSLQTPDKWEAPRVKREL